MFGRGGSKILTAAERMAQREAQRIARRGFYNPSVPNQAESSQTERPAEEKRPKTAEEKYRAGWEKIDWTTKPQQMASVPQSVVLAELTKQNKLLVDKFRTGNKAGFQIREKFCNKLEKLMNELSVIACDTCPKDEQGCIDGEQARHLNTYLTGAVLIVALGIIAKEVYDSTQSMQTQAGSLVKKMKMKEEVIKSNDQLNKDRVLIVHALGHAKKGAKEYTQLISRLDEINSEIKRNGEKLVTINEATAKLAGKLELLQVQIVEARERLTIVIRDQGALANFEQFTNVPRTCVLFGRERLLAENTLSNLEGTEERLRANNYNLNTIDLELNQELTDLQHEFGVLYAQQELIRAEIIIDIEMTRNLLNANRTDRNQLVQDQAVLERIEQQLRQTEPPRRYGNALSRTGFMPSLSPDPTVGSSTAVSSNLEDSSDPSIAPEH